MYFDLERVIKGAEYRWRQVDVKPDGEPSWVDPSGNMYWGYKAARIAFLGHGSTVAYYLTALRQGSVAGNKLGTKEDPFLSMLLFGDTDPWSSDIRGDGYINHEQHQIGHWGKTVDEFSDEYMQRSAFAEQNAAAFRLAIEHGATLVTDRVVKVVKVGDIFHIHTAKDVYPASFVIAALGLGAHRGLGDAICPKVPDNQLKSPATLKQELRGRVVNLDEFMNLPGFGETEEIRGDTRKRLKPPRKQSVAVHGTNAGIDAVQRAWQRGHGVTWIWGNQPPKFLPGHRLPVGKEGVEDVAIKKLGRVAITLEPQDDKVLVKYLDNKVPQELVVDVYVIALGQDPFAESCIGDVLIAQGGMKVADFEPIYDWNQHFGLPFQTILGFQTKGTRPARGHGLQIIGGATETLSKDDKFRVQHNYGEQLGEKPPKPTLEGCKQERVDYKSIREKYETDDALLQVKLVAWNRAIKNGTGMLELAVAYLEKTAMLTLLTHQIDPDAVPEGLADLIEKAQIDDFQKRQVATPRSPGGSGVASVLLPSQLGAVRAVAAALNSMIPDYVASGDSNFNTDDRTMLAVYVTQNFPNLTEIEVKARVDTILQLRRKDYTPLGFYDDRLRKTIQNQLREKSDSRK